MPVTPLVQFKAGICDIDDSEKPWKIKPRSTPGFIYLYKDEDLAHFCWRPRTAPLEEAGNDVLDLIMFPEDGSFTPWQPSSGNIAGRIYRLGFQSSSEKHFFWLQSKSQDGAAAANHWTDKDYSLGRIVTEILSGGHINAADIYRQADLSRDRRREDEDEEDDEDDTEMRDAEDDDDEPSSTGGAGAGATRRSTEGGKESRQGGGSGARAPAFNPQGGHQSLPADAQAAVRNLINFLDGNPNLSNTAPSTSARSKPFTTLPELLKPETTIDAIQSASEELLDDLLSDLPAQLMDIGRSKTSTENVTHDSRQTETSSYTVTRKRETLVKVLRSPQFVQSLASLTVALRDGGLPSISDSLDIEVVNGGYAKGGRQPLGGDQAVEAFVNGARRTISKEPPADKDVMGN